VKKLLEAADKAKQDTARYMTAQLRRQALHHGWDADVVSTLHVSHADGKFSAQVHPDHADRAFVHEYGNEHVRPTAVIRKFMNDPQHVNNAFIVTLNNRWKEVK
jgi:hypothetical protein